MASVHYYYIRVYDDRGKPLSTRCEKATGPRAACKLAFGVIYDNDYDTATYYDLGTRAPRYLSQRRLQEIERDKAGWKRIPPNKVYRGDDPAKIRAAAGLPLKTDLQVDGACSYS